MDDLTNDERTRTQATKLLEDYEHSLIILLANEIVRHEEDFKDTVTPLHGSVPAILQKYYGVFNSLWVAKQAVALDKRRCG